MEIQSDSEKPIIILKRVGKRNELSERAIKEQRIVNQRIKNCGENFQNMPKLLDSVFHCSLTFHDYKNIASEIIKLIPIRIDRLSKRNKSAMVCWFVENWAYISIFLPQISANLKLTNQQPDEKIEEFTVPTKHNQTAMIIFPRLCPVF